MGRGRGRRGGDLFLGVLLGSVPIFWLGWSLLLWLGLSMTKIGGDEIRLAFDPFYHIDRFYLVAFSVRFSRYGCIA